MGKLYITVGRGGYVTLTAPRRGTLVVPFERLPVGFGQCVPLVPPGETAPIGTVTRVTKPGAWNTVAASERRFAFHCPEEWRIDRSEATNRDRRRCAS